MAIEEVGAYKCDFCGFLTDDKAKADEHAEIDTLPVGLVYDSITGWSKSSIHQSYYHVLISPVLEKGEDIPRFKQIVLSQTYAHKLDDPREMATEDVQRIKNLIKAGHYYVLTLGEFAAFQVKFEEQLQEIKREHGIRELIRTTPELEEIVAQRAAKADASR